ncbi:VWA domain-containing protein [Actinomyces qiguomingii]|uniref:VWA domain-containing protein n=1 Tax=Actinomyces qiguomingii TaxID=2057800 RepID=UPI000CA05F1B|nr:VWA domain-containing protein [Actinomyces qiguomingii]
MSVAPVTGDQQTGPGPVTTEQRWRLMLGTDDADRTGRSVLTVEQQAMDRALARLYDTGDDGEQRAGRKRTSRRGGLDASAPSVAAWLGDIRRYFPSRVVQVMQNDAIERFGLAAMLTQPEILETLEPDVHLVSALVQLSSVIPEESKQTARQVVNTVVEQVTERLANTMRQSVRGALDRANRTARPRPSDIDWGRTIAANLKNYLPEQRTIVPERLVGYGRRHRGVQREFAICLDQSGSMASSIVYASIMACVMASIHSLRTSLVAYSTDIVDLTSMLADPVDVIFGTQLGGGTDTAPALEHCRRSITRPPDAVVILISDLYDARPERMIDQVRQIRADGATMIALLTLSDDGVPSYNRSAAAELAGLGVPAFGCTPDAFPELIAAAIEGREIGAWAERREADPLSREGD